jgi:hypothetical protein
MLMAQIRQILNTGKGFYSINSFAEPLATTVLKFTERIETYVNALLSTKWKREHRDWSYSNAWKQYI